MSVTCENTSIYIVDFCCSVGNASLFALSDENCRKKLGGVV